MSQEALVVYHIVVMHSQCTLACPTLSVWSPIQAHGLGLRTQTRGIKVEARDKKTKKTKSARKSFGFGWSFGTVFFLIFESTLLNRAKTPAFFVFHSKTDKHMCFLVSCSNFSVASPKMCQHTDNSSFFPRKPKKNT